MFKRKAGPVSLFHFLRELTSLCYAVDSQSEDSYLIRYYAKTSASPIFILHTIQSGNYFFLVFSRKCWSDAAVQERQELSLFEEIQASIEQNYINGLPLHHQSSAWEEECITTGPQSCIFVVDWETFRSMSPAEIQTIFSRRHILVLGTPLQDEGFKLETLDKLVDVDCPITIQGKLQMVIFLQVRLTNDFQRTITDVEHRTTSNAQGCHRNATIGELYAESQKKNGRVLNALDIPLGFEQRGIVEYE